MNFNVALAFLTAVATAGIALMALWRDPRSFVHRVFALGMIVFAADAACELVSIYLSTSFENFLFLSAIRLIVSSFLPAMWLLFSISFALSNYSEQISKWKWVLVLAVILPFL